MHAYMHPRTLLMFPPTCGYTRKLANSPSQECTASGRGLRSYGVGASCDCRVYTDMLFKPPASAHEAAEKAISIDRQITSC